MAMFIVVVDSTMMTVAVPTIVNDLDTSVSAVQSVIAMYSLVMAALMLTGGKLGSILGIRKAFLVGIILYGAGTLLAAISWNIFSLAFGWALLEGMGAALLVPAAFTVVGANYQGKNRAFAFGVLAGVQATAAAIGPILGGLLTTYLSWRWGFGGQIVVALAILPLIPFILELQQSGPRQELDMWGVVLSSLGMLLLVLGFLVAGRYGWWDARRPFELWGVELNPLGLSPSPFLILSGLVLLVAFLHWQEFREKAGRMPLVQPRILSNTRFITGASIYMVRSIFLTGLLFVLPLYMQAVLGFSAFQCGVALLPFSASVFIVSMITAGWSEWVTPRKLIQIGLILMALGTLYLYAVTSTDMNIGTFVLPTIVLGTGMGLIMAQLVNLTLSSVQPEDTSEASGLNNAVGELGNSLGTAVIGSLLLVFFYSAAVDQISRQANLSYTFEQRNQVIVELEDAPDLDTEAGQREFFADLPDNVKDGLPLILDDASVRALQHTLLVILVVIILTLLVSTFLSDERVSSKDRQRFRQLHPGSTQQTGAEGK
ncbi:MAG: MFS transporter [Pirellulaceae bacterium]